MFIYKLSYDHDLDCIPNLAEYYHVDTETIRLKAKEINELIKSESNLDIGTKVNLINWLVTGNKQRTNEIIRVSFYHRCISSGVKEWFSDGLLNSEDGLKSFFKKVDKLFPYMVNNDLATSLQYALKSRIDLEKGKQDKVGIFAFTRLEEAKEALQYEIPEICRDVGQSDRVDKLKDQLKSNLTQTIVKFYKEYEASESDEIIHTYWNLLCQQFDEALTSNSQNVGKGIDIPFHHIERIYYQDKNNQQWHSLDQ